MARASRQTTRPTLGPRCADQQHDRALRGKDSSVSSPLPCTLSTNGSLHQIHQNVLTGIQALCTAVMDLGLTGETDDDALELMDEILNISEGQVDLSEDKDIGNKLSSLWRDPAIQAAWDRRSEFHIIESHAAYFEKMDVICAPNYEPSKDDILASRVRTTGVIQEEYMIWGSKFVIIDVGGQTSERRKWVHHFDACQAILFVAALSEYDQYLFEDNTKNRMVDALELFEKICNEKLFKETHMILFLNKRDLFEQKIQHTAISSVPFFEDYAAEGRPENDKDAGMEYFKDKFMEQNKTKAPFRKDVFAHVTCATDTNNVEHIFNACKAIILKDTLSASGFMA
mmetsp:Transcript_72368/g.205850  ORF Transcript_72368/g.205850 Transcript_72368/m.205850 type:complete len:342 (+) Transcript_72368:577-1602(+)